MPGLIKLQSGPLATALDLARLSIAEKQVKRIPAMGAVRLTGGDGLTVTATGFDSTITTVLGAEAEDEMAVPLHRLADLTAAFSPDEEIVIAVDGNVATVAAGRSRFKLPLFPIPDLPQTHVLDGETGCVELDAQAARDIFGRPLFAVSDDPARHYLNGLFLHNVDDNLVAVATDGYRLVRITTPATTTLSEDRGLIVPRETLKTVNRLLSKATGIVTMRRSERLFAIEVANSVLITKRIDANYPDYERLLSAERPNTVTTSRVRLDESLERFAAVADPDVRTHIVRLRWDSDGLHLSTAGDSEDHLAADVEGEGNTATQIRFLSEMLDAMRGASVRLSTADNDTAILVIDPEDENFTALQMPCAV